MKTFYAIYFLFFTTAFTAVAHGQAQTLRHTFVSVTGLDTNGCSRTAPCRQIQRAVNHTLTGGTVTVLDSGEFQNFSVNKSIRVAAAPGAIATIVSTSPGNVAILVGGTTAINVAIKGFVIGSDNGNGIATENQVGTLFIDDCDISANLYGLSLTGGGRYYVDNVNVKNGLYGVWVSTATGETTMSVRNSSFRNTSVIAMYLGQNSVSTITDTVVDGNLNDAIGGGGGNVRFLIDRCTIANNDSDGVSISSGITGRVSDSVITNNSGYGIRNNGGTARTFGNNRITSNTLGNFSGIVSAVSPL